MISSLFTSAALAAAASVNLLTESSNPAYDGKGIAPFHESASTATAFLIDDASKYDYVYEDGEFKFHVNGDIYFTLGKFTNSLVFGPDESAATEQNGYLAVDGSDSVFYICDGYVPYDPYHYAAQDNNYGVSVYSANVPDNCEAIKIKVIS